jgi:hypothetical protein
MRKLMAFFIALMLLSAGCGNAAAPAGEEKADKSFRIVSQAFKEGEAIPELYTCDGGDLSPQISWYSIPESTASLALTCDDPDAPNGLFTHWIVYDMLPVTPRLPEDQPKTRMMINGASQGENDFGNIGWGGPCPPPGKPHRYVFTIYALDKSPEFPKPPLRADFDKAIEGHVIAKATLTGTYKKK